MKILDVYIHTNGMIMSFDKEGKQIPECQGFILDDEVVENLKKYADENTHFIFSKWKKMSIECDFSWWFKKQKEAKEKNAIQKS